MPKSTQEILDHATHRRTPRHLSPSRRAIPCGLTKTPQLL